MLNKFFNFLKGYVIIVLSGKNSERFINICLHRGIAVWGLNRRGSDIEMRVFEKDFKKLVSVRRKTKVRIRLIGKKGMKRLIFRYRKRFVFVLCAVLCAVMIYNNFNHIWAVEINGINTTDSQRIAELLEENGVYIGASKSKMPPVDEIKNNVLAGYEDITWLWIYMEGSKARVEVFERRVPPQIIDRTLAADIISTGEGVIKKMTVKLGDPCVKEGDAVTAGDTLISGKVKAFREGEEENYLYVHSLGEVLAYTMHYAEKEEKLYDEIRTPTGNKKRFITLELFGKKYEFFNEKTSPYTDYDIKTSLYELNIPGIGYCGIGLNIETDTEVETSKSEISKDLAIARAQDALEEQIAKELAPLSEKTDERIEYETADDETITVRCTMSFIENIGTEEIIKE